MKISFTLLFVVILSASCHKYLDVKPKGVVLPEKVDEFEGILNSETLTRTFAAAVLYSTDDIYTNFSKIDLTSEANAYFWKPNLDRNTDLSPAIWGSAYRSIYNTNVIINNVVNAKGASDQKKNEVMAEALVMRADCYFTLLTAFCKAYNASTASGDPGLPLVTGTDVTSVAPQRSTLKATVDTMINNLTMAVNLLPETAINKARVTKYIACAVLARLYLYISDFENAGKYAAMALESPHSLKDYNEVESVSDFPVIDLDPEVLWLRIADALAAPSGMVYSDDLISRFDENDLRFVLLTYSTTTGTTALGRDDWSNFGIDFPELYLIRAESLARKDDIGGAMEIINMIRSKRIRSSAYVPLSATNKEDAITKVLDERRRELAFRGQRFADMKRLSVEGRMPEVKRLNKATGEVLETLTPQSEHYVFEIPVRVLLFNSNMQKNF